MAITFPRDIPSCAAFASHRFEPRYQQAEAMTGGGSPQAADVGPAMWVATYEVNAITRPATAEWEAWLHSLRGRLRSFKGRPPGHRWLMSYPRGYAGLTVSGSPWSGLGTLSAIGAQRDTITIGGIPNGLVVLAGDYASFAIGSRHHLYRAVEGGVATSNSVTITIEPIVRPDAVTGGSVRFVEPYCDMVLDGAPQISGSNHKRASISFSGVQVLK